MKTVLLFLAFICLTSFVIASSNERDTFTDTEVSVQKTTSTANAIFKSKVETSSQSYKSTQTSTKGGLFVFVQGGTFMMGCNIGQSGCRPDESPAHQVTVGSFKISKTEVTVAQYAQFVDVTGYTVKGENWKYWSCAGSNANQCNMPVVNVTWHDALAFCNWAGGRLPTEAEWEYAARGGNKSNKYKYSGGDNLFDVGWFEGNSDNAEHTVATKKANELGLFDMSGNVWEWCSDWYGSDYYTYRAGNNPAGASSGRYRVARGGSWVNAAANCRFARRDGNTPGSSYGNLGFRVVLSQ